MVLFFSILELVHIYLQEALPVMPLLESLPFTNKSKVQSVVLAKATHLLLGLLSIILLLLGIRIFLKSKFTQITVLDLIPGSTPILLSALGPFSSTN